MRQEVVVEHELRPLALVVLRLVRCELLADVHDTAVDRVALALFEVLHHERQDILIGGNGIHDFLIVRHAESTHQVHKFEVAGDGRERDLEQVLLIPLDDDQCPVPAELREDFRDIDPLVVALGELGHDLVGGEILEGHEHALGAVDNEISARIECILAMGDPLGVVHAVQVAGVRTDHDRQLPDRGDDWLLPLVAMDERQPETGSAQHT